MEDSIQDSGRTIRVNGHNFWTIQCTKHFHKGDELSA